MYAHQIKNNFLDNQCALLKERIDRVLGHNKTIVRTSRNDVLIFIHNRDLPKLKHFPIPDRIGTAKVIAKLK